MPDLDADAYTSALDLLATSTAGLILIADDVDVARLRQQCEQMQAIGPIFEPTAYMRGGMTNLRDQAAFLAALETFVVEVRKLDRTTTQEINRADAR